MSEKSVKKQLKASFYSKNRLALGVAVFAALLHGTLSLILSWIIQQLIDTASGVEGALSLGMLSVITAGFVGLCVAVLMLSYVSEPRFIARATRQYKDLAFDKLTQKSVSSFRDENTATYLSALTNDAGSIEEDYLAQRLSLITKAVKFIGALVIMLYCSPVMTLVAVALTALPFAASLPAGNNVRKAEKRISDRNRDFTATLTDCLAGFSVVKTFRAEKEIFGLFAESNRALEKEKFNKRRLKIIVGMIGSVTGVIAQLGVFIFGVYLVLSDSGMTTGTIFMFVNLMNFMIEPLSQLPTLLASGKAALGLVGKLADALEKSHAPDGKIKIGGVKNNIALENVRFGYEDGKDVLKGVSAVFEAGKAYAVVGASGSGKSTLLNLLTAASADYRGKITLDGTDIRDISAESLYGAVSLIQQNVFVFNASVRDNITMFKNFTQADIDEAARRAQLAELVNERGDEYLCGENGKGLSGGEKQRVSIARSLLKKSSVLLADEATAALDAKTAAEVTYSILSLDGITRIVVTHAIEETLLRRFDGILVMKDGKVGEFGTFDNLMKEKGYFYALFTVTGTSRR